MASSAVAFTPFASTRSAVRVTADAGPATEPESAPAPVEPATPPAPVVSMINGWAPDARKPCFGLPGAIAPLGFFDPLGFTKDAELSKVKRFREAEIMHCRVSMLATVGYLLGENTPTITYGFDHPTIANNQLAEAPGPVLFALFLVVNILEAYRAADGWIEPRSGGAVFTLRDRYYPGDLGVDPMGLKPTEAKEFATMQTKELSNGRLAMLAVAGMCVQELLNGKPMLADLSF